MIHQVQPSDCLLLSQLGIGSYRAHFAHIWSDPAAMNTFLSSFEPDRLMHELTGNGPGGYYFFRENDTPVGFAKVTHDSPLPGSPGKTGWCLDKIYFLPSATGKGYGNQLIKYVIKLAQQQTVPFAWLDVLESNTGARQLYQRLGFVKVAQSVFPTDKGDLNLWIMKKDLSAK